VISDAYSDAQLVLFPNLSQYWKSFGAYSSCVEHAVKVLQGTGLYDAALAPDPKASRKLFKQ